MDVTNAMIKHWYTTMKCFLILIWCEVILSVWWHLLCRIMRWDVLGERGTYSQTCGRFKVTLKTFHCDSEPHASEVCGGVHVYQSLIDWLRVFLLFLLPKRYIASINSLVRRESCLASLDAYAAVGLWFFSLKPVELGAGLVALETADGDLVCMC